MKDLAALLTRLDLYNSELALASSPVLLWNLCIQSEIWVSIVICGLAAVVGQASKAHPPPPPQFSFSNEITPLSSYVAAASCARALSAPLYPFTPSPLPVTPPLIMFTTWIYRTCVLCCRIDFTKKTRVYLVSGSGYYVNMWEGFPSYYILFL